MHGKIILHVEQSVIRRVWVTQVQQLLQPEYIDFGLGSAGTRSGSGELDIYSPSLSGHYHSPKLCLI